MINIDNYKAAFKNLPPNVEWAEVNADSRDEFSVSFRNGKQSGTELYSKTVYYLQASSNGKKGIVYTEKADEDPYTLIKHAVECAGFTDLKNVLPQDKNANIPCIESESGSEEDILAFAEELIREALILQDYILQSCSIRRMNQSRRVTNSLGLDNLHNQTYYLVNLDMGLKNKTGANMKAQFKRNVKSLSMLNSKELIYLGIDKLKQKTHDGKLNKTTLSTGKHNCVLSADVVCNILNTAWQEFTGTNINAGISIYKDLNDQVGPAIFNIIDAPNHPEWGFEAILDSEGVINKEKYIVKNGHLLNPMHTLLSADEAAQHSTGNAGRAALLSGTIPVNILTIPGIFYIKPGSKSPNELINEMNTGVYLTYSLDVFHSINIASGEFSIPCGGIVYNDGKPVGTIEQVTIAGNLKDLFINIQDIGSDLQFEEFHYKNYCFGGPSLFIKDLAFSSSS